jgi:hypothetical protein
VLGPGAAALFFAVCKVYLDIGDMDWLKAKAAGLARRPKALKSLDFITLHYLYIVSMVFLGSFLVRALLLIPFKCKTDRRCLVAAVYAI